MYAWIQPVPNKRVLYRPFYDLFCVNTHYNVQNKIIKINRVGLHYTGFSKNSNEKIIPYGVISAENYQYLYPSVKVGLKYSPILILFIYQQQVTRDQ